MGFESSQVARRRLASLASSNGCVQEALSSSSFPGFKHSSSSPKQAGGRDVVRTSGATNTGALVRHLDDLAQEIVAVPGAGGALLAAFAAQARALSMVVEAAKRANGGPLPAAVVLAAQEALAAHCPLPGLVIG